MRPYFKYYKHASSCLSGDVVSRSGLYMRDARVRVGSSVGRESDRRASGRGHVRVVGARVVVSGIGEKRVRCIYAPGFLTPFSTYKDISCSISPDAKSIKHNANS